MRHVALLYSIVLAPGRRVVMGELRALAMELGFADPRTVLASGNLAFDADEPDPRAVEEPPGGHGGATAEDDDIPF